MAKKLAKKHLMHLDIKAFDDEKSMEVLIRSMGTPYNPLDFELDSE